MMHLFVPGQAQAFPSKFLLQAECLVSVRDRERCAAENFFEHQPSNLYNLYFRDKK